MREVKLVYLVLGILFLSANVLAAPGSGGNITHDGNYVVHTFLSNGTFTPPTGVTNVSVLVVAGGGGGGAPWGGAGGGAGGLNYTNYSISSQSYTLIVGTGGAGGSNGQGSNGGNSSFGSIVAIGGGGGGGYSSYSGKNGGSGGGAEDVGRGGIIGLGTNGQGYNGGQGTSDGVSYTMGGGGGGAGSVGGTSSGSSTAGNGGTGINISINGSIFCYAGGGGGGNDGASGSAGIAVCGGGAGTKNGAGVSATANTGGGGGGGGGNPGGSGGSGIIIVRYLETSYIVINANTPANNSYSNSLTQTLSANIDSTLNLSNATIYVWNSSGSLYNEGSYMYDTGKALRFDGSNDYITTATINHNIGTGNFAYSAWVYPLAYSGSPTGSSIIANGNYYPLIYINTKNLSIYSGGGTDLKCNVNLNNWSHITVTRTSGIIRGYVNGIICPINPTIATSYANAGQAIGRNGVSTTGDYFNGSIDQVLFFNRSLNSTEISQLYNSGMGLYANTSIAPFNSGLVVGYHFDNDSTIGENNTNFVDINGAYNATCSGVNCPNYTVGFLRGPAFLTSTINFTMGVYNATLGSIINFINGVYTWAYQVFDSAGTSSMMSNYTLNIDTISPTFVSLSPANNTLTRNTLITFNINISDENGIKNATLNIFNSGGENVALEKTIYDYTGEDQRFTVPEGVTSISVKAWGAGGGGYNYASNANKGGGGGYSNAELTVTPGENLTIVVGSGGSVCPSATNPGAIVYGGGGQCGDLGYGGQGGGLSGVFNGSETIYFNSTSQSRTLIIAGGGGGAGAMGGVGNIGGAGGGLFGDASNCSGVNGMPGSQTSGGIGYGVNGSGSALRGGRASDSDGGGGGGGGAGYFGGGAGTNGASGTYGCGGGGSGYVITGTTTAGNGQDPGSKEDIDRGTAGIGGNTNVAGNNGRVIITYSKINYSNSVFSEDLKNANITATTSLSDGNYTWFFESYDLAGNYNASENSTLVADVTSPQISFATTNGTGGNITYDGNYTVHTFLTNGTFVPPVGVTNVSILVVGGGGGGGKAEPSRWGGGAGGGGGGGASGGSFDKSSATFELVRGNNQEFELILENKLSNPRKDITITVKGNNSQYVIPSPNLITYLGAKSNETINFLINAPSYFASGKYLLEITFTGTIEGNTSTKFTEIRYVTLMILEMKRATADEYLNNSLEILNKMTSSGLILDEVQSILNSMNTNYENLNFMNLKEEAAKITEIYTAAREYVKLRDELNQSMIESEKNGVVTSETKKLFLLAEILFNRGDYVAAYEKMKEAKTSYLLETKGEFKILYAIKNNPVESLGILISISALGLGSSYFVRMRLLKRKLRMLAEEEGLLLQLMRVVQRDCFENNKMSMEEYGESMYQYEARLSAVIQEKVTTETQIANLMKIGGKKGALGQERDRLTILIRQTQDDYMNRERLDTRIYENMLKTYATRLSKIEEQLVFIEAKEQINQVTGFWQRIFNGK